MLISRKHKPEVFELRRISIKAEVLCQPNCIASCLTRLSEFRSMASTSSSSFWGNKICEILVIPWAIKGAAPSSLESQPVRCVIHFHSLNSDIRSVISHFSECFFSLQMPFSTRLPLPFLSPFLSVWLPSEVGQNPLKTDVPSPSQLFSSMGTQERFFHTTWSALSKHLHTNGGKRRQCRGELI